MQLVLRGEGIFEELDAEQQDELWRPEFASYMLEGPFKNLYKKSSNLINESFCNPPTYFSFQPEIILKIMLQIII